MSRNTRVALFVALVIVVASVAGMVHRHGNVPPAIDLVERLGVAETHPTDTPFPTRAVTIDGDRQVGIVVYTNSRIIWRVVLPAPPSRRRPVPGALAASGWWDALVRGRAAQGIWLRTHLALDPAVWDKDGDGMLFRIGIRNLGDAQAPYREIFSQYLNPRGALADRRWVTVSLDLTADAGEQVELIFNTNTGLPGHADARNDIGIWGAPGVYLRP
jgi:hypothetical protein